jgi:broad specificity phosphatase PhoE
VTIYLVRHGETEWNLERRYQGRFDSPLTEAGMAQASAIGRLLAVLPEVRGARFVASPQPRARRSAALIARELGRGMPRIDARLRELTLGAWDGLTFGEIEIAMPGIFDGDGRHEWYFRAPDGEAEAAFTARLAEWLAETSEKETVIAVTHGVVTRVLRGLYAGLPRASALRLPVAQGRVFRLAGGMVTELRVEDENGAA